jgi:hypothetical protein
MNQRSEVPEFMMEVEAELPSRSQIATSAVLLTGVLLLAGFLRFDRGHDVSARLLVIATLLAVLGRFFWWSQHVSDRLESTLGVPSGQEKFRSWFEDNGRLRAATLRERGRSYYVRTRLVGIAVPLCLALYAALVLVGPTQSTMFGATGLPVSLCWFVVASGVAVLLAWLQLQRWWSREERRSQQRDVQSPPT